MLEDGAARLDIGRDQVMGLGPASVLTAVLGWVGLYVADVYRSLPWSCKWRGHRRTEFWIPHLSSSREVQPCPLYLQLNQLVLQVQKKNSVLKHSYYSIPNSYPVSILVAEFCDTGWLRYQFSSVPHRTILDPSLSSPPCACAQKILSVHERNIWALMTFSILSVSLLLTCILYGKNIVIMK